MVALFVVMGAASKLHVPPVGLQWLMLVALLAAGVGQIIAIRKSQAIGKGRAIVTRALAFLCAAASWILLIFWLGWVVITAYYVIHPNAPPLYGGI